ncbi:MAG: YfhO family protein [bacterium]|nr:YfhO family protein [bacterium]
MRTEGERDRRLTPLELVVHAVLLLALLACVFPKTFFEHEAIMPGGFLYATPPWEGNKPTDLDIPANWLTVENLQQVNKFYLLTSRCISDGEWPLWNPLEFTGMPLMQDYQTAIFYPPRLLHAFLEHHFATSLYILLKLWLCGFTAYLYGRYIRLSTHAARFLSVAWMLGTYNLIWCYWPVPDVSAWAALVLLAVEMLLDGRYRRGFFSLCFGATMLLLSGHPETAFAMGLGVGLYFALRLTVERRWGRRLWKPAAIAGAAWAVALLVCAVQILPFLEYMLVSHTFLTREITYEEKHFLPLGASLILWVSRFFGTKAEETYWASSLNSTYLGMVYSSVIVWIAAALIVLRGKREQTIRAVCLSMVTAVSILMCFDLPGVRVIQNLPGFDFMWRCYFIAFSRLALPILAAIGLDRWLAKPRRLREIIPAAAVCLVGIGVSWFSYRFFAGLLRAQAMAGIDGLDVYVRKQVIIAAAVALGALAILVAHSVWKRPWACAAALTALLAFDLVFAVRGLLPTAPPEAIFPETGLTNYLSELPKPTRVSAISARTIRPALMYPYGIEEHWGSDGIYPERVVTLYGRLGMGTHDGAIWNAMEPVCGVGYYLHNPSEEPAFPLEDTERFEKVVALDGIEVYRNKKAFPRAFLVGDLKVEADKNVLFEVMGDPTFDPGACVVAERAPSGEAPTSSDGPLGTAQVTARSWNRVVVELDVDMPCYLVLSDAYMTGWHATVDEDSRDIFPAYYAFRGVVVHPGETQVVFEYDPASFRIGMGLSVATLIGGVLAATVLLVRRRQP